MAKSLVILILGFFAGVAGNLLAGWVQQDVWLNLFQRDRLIATGVAVTVMLFFTAWLETERALAWNWWWHRFWYLQELLTNRKFRHWEKDYARLDLNITKGKRRVALREVLVAGERRDLLEVLKEVVVGRGTHRALVLGEPGSGKTTGMQRLALDLARAAISPFGVARPIPIFLELGTFQDGDFITQIGTSMQLQTRNRSGRVLSKGIKDLLSRGQVVLLLDAMDEALGERRSVVLAESKAFLESRAFEKVPVIITARTMEDPGQSLGHLPTYELQDLSDPAVEIFVRAHNKSSRSHSEIMELLKRNGLLESGALARNPFWLGLIVDFGIFVGGRGAILNENVDNLLGREWDTKQETTRTWRRVLPREDQLDVTKRGLAWLGYEMSRRETRYLDKNTAITVLADWLRTQIGMESIRPQDILGLGRDAQLLFYQLEPVTFRHRLLQEFMAAWMLFMSENLSLKQALDVYAEKSVWWQTLSLLGDLARVYASKQAFEDLVRQILGDGADMRRVFLALRMMQGVENPSNELIDSLLSAFTQSGIKRLTNEEEVLARELIRVSGKDEAIQSFGLLVQSVNRRARTKGILMLALVKGQRATQLLLGPIARGADATQLTSILRTIGRPAQELLGESLNHPVEQLRLIATKLLESLGDHYALPYLVKTLSDDNYEVRISVIRALGHIADAIAVEPLTQVLSQENERVQASVGKQDGEEKTKEQKIIEEDQKNAIRLAIIAALNQIGDTRAVPAIRNVAESDARVSVRREAVHVLGLFGAVSALAALISVQNSDLLPAIADALRLVGMPAGPVAFEMLKPLPERIKNTYQELKSVSNIEPNDDKIRQRINALETLAYEDISLFRQLMDVLSAIGDIKLYDSVQRNVLENLSPELAKRILGSSDRTLSRSPAPQNIPQIMAGLQSTELYERKRAADQLASITDPRYTNALVEALRGSDLDLSEHIATVLSRMGPTAVQVLAKSLFDPDPKMRASAARVLGRISGSSSAKVLVEHLNDSSAEVRQSIVALLGDLHDPYCVEPLMALMEDPVPEVRAKIVEALSKLDDERAEGPMLQALSDESDEVCWAAAMGVGLMGLPEAIDALIALLANKSPWRRTAGASALGQIGHKRAVPFLIQSLRDPDPCVRWSAADALGKIGDSSAILELEHALYDQNPHVCWTAANALGLIGRPQASEALIAVLHHENWEVAKAAARALITIHGWNAGQILLETCCGEGYARLLQSDYVR